MRNTTVPGPSLGNSIMLILAALIGVALAFTATLVTATLFVRYCLWIVHLTWELWR